MPSSATRKARSQALATIERLATHLALLADAKAAIAGVDLNAGIVKPDVRRSLQRALAYSPDRQDKRRRARKRR